MWVDIANLTGPRGRDGQDGLQGPPGPVNIGLDPNEPISWDQSGGFTFKLVDGSEQTVNLPIASAQSAGLLGAAGALPTTGLRNIISLLTLVPTSGGIFLERTGPLVFLSFDRLMFDSPPAVLRLVTNLPSGFRPRSRRETSVGGGNGESTRGMLQVDDSGAVWLHGAPAGQSNRASLAYPTGDSWPSTLPGEFA